MVGRFAAGSLVIVAVIASSVVIVRGHEDDSGPARQAGVVRPPVPTVAGPRINGPPKPVRNRFTVDPARPPTAVRIELKQEPAAGLLFDVRNGRVLWQLHPRRELPIASLTKMLTALLIAERHRPRGDGPDHPPGDQLRGLGRGSAATGKAGPVSAPCSTA